LVSLLQDFVLDSLLSNFTAAEAPKYEITFWMIEIPKISGGSHFQRYLIHCKPADKTTFHIKESIDAKTITLESCEEVKNCIKMSQVQHMIGPMQVEMKEFKLGQKYQVQTDDHINGRPRYSLHVIDADDKDDLDKKTLGCFVVPLGLEREMQIETFEAQLKIRRQTGYARLVIVVLGRGHKYATLQQIQDELSPKVMDLCPSDCSNRT